MSALAITLAAFVCSYPAVHDGDTWRCHEGMRVRMWGVDAPELRNPGGPEATRALSKLISGKTLNCYRKGQSYDRVVAQCFLGDRDIAAEMVRERQAVDWPRYSRGFYAR